MRNFRTEHFPLLLHDSTQVPEDFMQFMNPGLDLPNLVFAFLDKGFLVGKLSGRQLCLEDLSLALLDSAVVLCPAPGVIKLRTGQGG